MRIQWKQSKSTCWILARIVLKRWCSFYTRAWWPQLEYYIQFQLIREILEPVIYIQGPSNWKYQPFSSIFHVFARIDSCMLTIGFSAENIKTPRWPCWCRSKSAALEAFKEWVEGTASAPVMSWEDLGGTSKKSPYFMESFERPLLSRTGTSRFATNYPTFPS